MIDAPAQRLDDGSESTAYFVVAEAVTNAQKHARASRITIRFDLRPGVLAVEIADDGVGGAVEHAGLGLEGLRDRVEGIGGSIVIDSATGAGTRVAAEIPAMPRPAATGRAQTDYCVSPARKIRAAFTRRLTSSGLPSSSFMKIAFTCFSTARLVRYSDDAIAALLLP